MATALHTDLPIGEIHIPHQWEYANAAARLAAVGFVAEDKYKLAVQLDSITLWMLTNHSPITWTQITAEDPGNVTSLKLPAIKASAGTIYPGQPLYLLGLNIDGNALVEVADADDPAKMPAVGLAEDQFTNVVPGHGVFIGPIYGQETATWAPGTLLYVGSSPGTLTATRPTGVATYVQPVAVVMVQAPAPNGIIAATAQGYYWWPNLTEGYIPIGQAGNGLPTFRLFAHGHTGAGDGGVLANAQRGVAQNQIVYVGKHGNDSQDGSMMELAKLTFGSAITRAIALGPTQNNPISIVCNDGGIYAESISVPSFVSIHAPNANLFGTAVLADDSNLDMATVINNAGSDTITKSSGSGAASVILEVLNCLGTNTNGIVCTSGAIEFDIQVAVVQNGTALGAATSQRINGHVGEILIGGTGKGIALSASGGKCNIHFDRIYGPSGTGVDVANGAEARIVGEVIDCSAAWVVAAGGVLYFLVANVMGTRTNNGTARGRIGSHNFVVYAEAMAAGDTTSQTYQNRLSVALSASDPAGRYLLTWNYTYSFDSYSMDGFKAQIRRGSPGTQLWEQKCPPPTSDLNGRTPASGSLLISHVGGAETWYLDWCSGVNNKTARITQASIRIEKKAEA